MIRICIKCGSRYKSRPRHADQKAFEHLYCLPCAAKLPKLPVVVEQPVK